MFGSPETTLVVEPSSSTSVRLDIRIEALKTEFEGSGNALGESKAIVLTLVGPSSTMYGKESAEKEACSVWRSITAL